MVGTGQRTRRKRPPSTGLPLLINVGCYALGQPALKLQQNHQNGLPKAPGPANGVQCHVGHNIIWGSV